MAKNDTEVEIKTPISKERYRKIERYLKKNSKLLKLSYQSDTYYSPKGKLFLKPKHPYEWLSIRERDGKVILNYKHWYPEGFEETTHCDEYETEIGKLSQSEKILRALKFDKLVVVKKYRKVYVNGDLEISLDKVRDLGYFIEIESLNNRGGVEKTRQKILNLAKNLGIKRIVNVPGGYAAALMREKGLLK